VKENELMKNQNTIFTAILLMLVCFALVPKAQAVVPAPDGGYPGGNTAEGQSALFSLTTGTFNTAVGLFSLRSNTEGNFNTATGAGALLFNTGHDNTAIGGAALLFDTTGEDNTAIGAGVLLNNLIGNANTAGGAFALENNTAGNNNTAVGAGALQDNTTGNNDTAIGFGALLTNTSGDNNIALGNFAGNQVTTANNVICIGTAGQNEDDSCFIANIFDQTSSGGTAVFVNSSGKLGTTTSSRRFKDNIKRMENASEALFALKPVTFRYKKEIDPHSSPQFGLLAEDVEKVNRDLVVRDKQGKPYSVRYDQVNAMLLNEFLKEHRKMKDLEATVTHQQKQIQALVTSLQKVNARVEAIPVPRLVASNP
jgi:Chaperone of endosialidase